MNKILIPGTGNAQVDFIKYCKQQGYEVHAISYKKEGRGIQYADHFELINIIHTEAIKNYASDRAIDLIYTVGSEIAMPAVSEVSERLGLNHFVSVNTANTCNNKILLREKLEKLDQGNYSVKFLKVTGPEDAENWETFPAIVKPSDSQGQRGISKVKSKDELAKAIKTGIENSHNQTAIIEEYIDGFEISVNTYLYLSKPMFYFITERNSFQEFPGGIIKSHYFPVTQKINPEMTEKLVKEVCRELDIQNGPAYFQIKINRQGVPRLIEVAARFDGCHLWRLIRCLGGPDLFEVTLKHLEGNDITGYFKEGLLPENVRHAELFFFTQKPFTRIRRNDFDVSPKAVYQEWYYDDGEEVKPLNNYMEKVGYQINIEQ